MNHLSEHDVFTHWDHGPIRIYIILFNKNIYI